MTKRWFGGAALLVLAACGNDVHLEGGDGAFITGNAVLGADCTTTADAPLLQVGEYDIAAAGAANSDTEADACATSYGLRLVVETEANQIAVFDHATVTLSTLNSENLVFDGLANPFRLATAGSVRPEGDTPNRGVVEVVEAIPAVYAPSLEEFADSQVRIDVWLEGYLEDGTVVRTQEFEYPVDICDGCLTLCVNADILSGSSGVLPEDITDGQCNVQRSSGMDGRICLDPDC